jgi:hypothetical protein
VTVVSHPGYDRLLMGSPLRRSGVCLVICTALLVLLALASFVHLGLLAGMRSDVASVFYRALALSSVLSAVPLTVLWFLDRRERENPWLFAATFLWGGFIATGLALPFNTVFFQIVDAWVAQHPAMKQVLGPDATMMLAAPISAPIAEEAAKALGVSLLFWLLRAEFDNMRDGSAGEYDDIVGDRILRTRRIDPTRPRTSAALVNAQHELAFRKRRVRNEGKDPERDELAAGWRDEIRGLRAVL